MKPQINNLVLPLSGQKVLVTGAAGLVGRAVCKQLLKMGVELVAVSHSSKNIDGVNCVPMDLVTDSLYESFQQNMDAVVHLAAAVPHSSRYPDNEDSASKTIAIDQNILRAVNHWQCPVIYMSSCGLYDRTNLDVKYEGNCNQLDIVSPYFKAKLEGEKTFTDYENATIFRLAAPIGPGIKSTLVVSRFLQMAMDDEAIQIWGTGKREQNFIDARDVAELIARAIKHPHSGIYNLADANPVTMKELAEQVIKVCQTGSIHFPGLVDSKDNETARYSIDKVKHTFNWTPRYSLVDSLTYLRTYDA